MRRYCVTPELNTDGLICLAGKWVGWIGQCACTISWVGLAWWVGLADFRYVDGTSVREYVFFVFFRLKKHDFLRFFKMTYQKVVKSHQQKFSPQYVTKQWPLRPMITVIQFLAPKSHCWTFWLIGSIGRNKITNATKAAVAGLPGSKRRVGTLGSVRFWQQWRGTINIRQPYIRVLKLNIWLDYDANITK